MSVTERAEAGTWQNATPRQRVLIVVACAIALGALPVCVWINQTQELPVVALQWLALLAGLVALDRPAKAWPRATWALKVIAGVYLVAGLLFVVQ